MQFQKQKYDMKKNGLLLCTFGLPNQPAKLIWPNPTVVSQIGWVTQKDTCWALTLLFPEKQTEAEKN